MHTDKKQTLIQLTVHTVDVSQTNWEFGILKKWSQISYDNIIVDSLCNFVYLNEHESMTEEMWYHFYHFNIFGVIFSSYWKM